MANHLVRFVPCCNHRLKPHRNYGAQTECPYCFLLPRHRPLVANRPFVCRNYVPGGTDIDE